jgi:hypothetical protein
MSVAGYNKCNSFIITPALMMGMDEAILDRVAFGGVKEKLDLKDTSNGAQTQQV